MQLGGQNLKKTTLAENKSIKPEYSGGLIISDKIFITITIEINR